MNLLQGSIAFALALAGLATLCTVLIEILHRVAGWRADGLKNMLNAYFDHVIVARFGEEKPANLTELKSNYLDTLSESHLITHLMEGKSKMPLFVRRNMLQLESLSLQEFLGRLPDADVFGHLELTKNHEQQVQLLAELGEKYAHYGNAASNYFKRRAQFLSLILGLCLAVFGNIHAGRIFDAFVKDPVLAARMEQQADGIRSVIARQQAEQVADGMSQAALADINSQMQQVGTALEAYQKMGLPMGWTYYPNCFQKGVSDPDCKRIIKPATLTPIASEASLPASLWQTLCSDPGGFFLWLFTVAITGVLIGLGGPFWFDIAMKLSQVRDSLNGKPAQPEEKKSAAIVPTSGNAPEMPQGKHPWDDKPW